ncbi:hypothetical protein SAMN05216251_12714 [Actinacidiphila alni]|uniref:Uncharacterized protein n=1 Tax=Actinacidiphila alni TaxID=380248 RepID=A0A1I2L5W3_9ACTN|nr:hypothetical protein [Actinacidiphila alni]SFF74625.1 hypothetical protein SAMN05216251_12714 [Actinacidiphila alni]
MYLVAVREYKKTKSKSAIHPYRCVSHKAYSTYDESQISVHAIDILREAGPGARYSGMEEFDSAHAFWNEPHECPEDGPSEECEELGLEACREWVEKSATQIPAGGHLDLHLGLPQSFTEFVIRRV